MQFQNLAIETLAHVLPDEVWSSSAIEARLAPVYDKLKLPAGRLELMTGIKERRMWPEGMQPSEASAKAGAQALKESSIPKESIDLLIHCAVSRDRLEPATAAYVHEALGMSSQTQFWDLSNACLGFVNALCMAGSMIEGGQIRSALIVAGENGRSLVEGTIRELLEKPLTRKTIKPYFANLTVGCAAVGAVVCHASMLEQKPALRLDCATVRTNSCANRLCEGGSGSGDSLAMQTDSEQLLETGVTLAKSTWNAFCEESGWDADTPHRIICHQVGKQHQRRLYDGLGLSLEKDFSSFPYLGNVGAVALPVTLSLALEDAPPIRDEKMALLGIGSGLSSLMAAVHYE